MSDLSLVFCPDCQAELKSDDATIECSQCDYRSRFVNGAPWLFKDPEVIRLEWINRYNAHLQLLQDRLQQAIIAGNDKSLMKLTRQRLESLQKAIPIQMQSLADLLRPLATQIHASRALNDLTNSVLSAKQQAETYGDNIFRDWAWKTNENHAHAQLVSGVADIPAGGKMAVLGAGAGRLAVDLHKAWKCQTTYVVDINPMLTFIAQKMVAGESFDFFEFPPSPASLSQHCVKQTLAAEGPLSGIEFLLADATAPPLQDHSMDIIVTPWFLDILPQDANFVIREINRVLKKGGHWVYFGPFFFDSAKESLAYSKEELLHLVEKTGFALSNTEEQEIPYMQSPSSCQKRNETVLCFAAQKNKEVDVFEEEVFRPPWIKDPNLPIPQDESFKSSAFVNQLHLEVLSSIDGQKSVADLAKEISQKYKVPEDEALGSVRTFFVKLIEKGIFKF